jgi:hypothetical protein
VELAVTAAIDILIESFIEEVTPVLSALAGFTVPLSFPARRYNTGRLVGPLLVPIYVHGHPTEINDSQVQASITSRDANGL